MEKDEKDLDNKNLSGGILPEQVAGWKLKYGKDNIHAIEIPLDDNGDRFVTAYVRKPDLRVVGAAGKFAQSDPVRSGLILFDNCYLGGDAEVQSSDELKMSVIVALNTLFRVRTARIKNV